MDVYIFQAALLCKHDGEKVRRELTRAGKAPEDPDDERSYDSDDFPKGPFPDGGGEADTPQHCDICHMFLENPLTSDGLRYVLTALDSGSGNPKVLAEWAAFYDLEGPVVLKRGERYYDRGDGLVRVGEMGSISEGTLKLDHLITAGMQELDRLDPVAMKEISKEYPDITERGFAESEDGEFAWQAIGEALGEHAPPNAFFGGAEGDPADVGFWFRDDL